MADKTPNYNLTKPVESEFYDIMVQNDNMDKIDQALSAKQDKLSANHGIDGVDFDGSAAIVHYGTCATAAATTAKAVALTGFKLVTGARVTVKFTYTNTAASPTLNVNSTGAKAIKKYGTTAPDTYMWQAGAVVEFVYDGTYWIMLGGTTASTTYYGMTKLSSSVSSTSTTLAATPSAVKQAYDEAQSKVPSTRTINGKALSADISLNAADVGAIPVFKNTMTSLGANANADGGDTVAIGSSASALQIGATAVGGFAQATANYSVAIGSSANSSGDQAVALGTISSASGVRAISIGSMAESAGICSTAIGTSSSASGANSIALGYGANVSANSSIALGSNAAASGVNAASATALGSFSNASANYSTALGYSANASGINATAVGPHATASGGNSTALGRSASAAGTHSTALGYFTRASSANSVALGYYANAAGGNSIALGCNTAASNINSMALGFTANAYGTHSVALGPVAKALGANSMAIGAHTNTSGNCATALGYYAVTANANSIQLGNASTLSSLTCLKSLTVTSDERDKTDIAPIGNAVDFLNRVRAFSYVRNDRELYNKPEEELSEEEREAARKYGFTPYDREAHAAGTLKRERRRVGVSAQAVRQALIDTFGSADGADIVNDNLHDFDPAEVPDWVESHLGVTYEKFIPFLIRAVQELDARLKELEAQNA